MEKLTRKEINARHKAKHRDRILKEGKEYRLKLKIETLNRYGNECSKCGYSDIRALQIDHIENNGNIERKELGGKSFSGWRFYFWLKKNNYPNGYQTLCANCNCIKHVENKG